MDRGRNEALRLDALKRAFLENLPQRAPDAGCPRAVLSMASIARASGFDVRKAISPVNDDHKSADARTQGRP